MTINIQVRHGRAGAAEAARRDASARSAPLFARPEEQAAIPGNAASSGSIPVWVSVGEGAGQGPEHLRICLYRRTCPRHLCLAFFLLRVALGADGYDAARDAECRLFNLRPTGKPSPIIRPNAAAAAGAGVQELETLLAENMLQRQQLEQMRLVQLQQQQLQMQQQLRQQQLLQFQAPAQAAVAKSRPDRMRGQAQDKKPSYNKRGQRERQTTVMLRNLPLGYSRDMLVELMNRNGFYACFDFVYIPINFRSQAMFGYAFVNFVDEAQALRARDTFEGFTNWGVETDKICEVSWSDMHQGLMAHVNRYRSSPVMHESVPDEYKPAVYSQGRRVPFPAPTKRIRVPRIRRGPEGGQGDDGEGSEGDDDGLAGVDAAEG
ncbi:mei2 [Symbiodinium pilosum]|uniref:Mei2 protein n=1 Tax=Symbiodinium pilosum TaxID=2952 RepID=A0A812VNU6_SYMPI|nr:mei2 [Symbiodinium pilosum]